MKTKKVIQLLQEIDPSGELEVCVGDTDIFTIHHAPAYYDGQLEVLLRDESNPFYDVIGAKIVCTGYKVQIHTLSIEDALYDAWNLRIETDCDNMPNNQLYQVIVERREEAYKSALDFDHYPCETCTKKPTDFFELDDSCYDCHPVNKFKSYVKAD
jgi:hypothetical protein